MPKNLTDVDPDESELSPEQQRLLLWRDYLALLRKGLSLQNGSEDAPWSAEKAETVVWLRVAISEIEGDVMHLECGQEEYCRWGDAKDLSKLDGNIDVSEE